MGREGWERRCVEGGGLCRGGIRQEFKFIDLVIGERGDCHVVQSRETFIENEQYCLRGE